MDAVERFCDRALLLEAGEVAAIGEPAEIARRYREANERAEEASVARDEAARPDLQPSRQSGRKAFAGERRPVSYRPAAVGGDLRRLASITSAIARSEFRMHYQDSVLGYLWSILRPLGLFAVLYLVFAKAAGLGRRGGALPRLPADRDRAVDLLRRDHLRRGGLAADHCGDAAEDALAAAGHPAVGDRKGAMNLALNLVIVAIALAIAGVEPRCPGSSCRCWCLRWACSPRASRCCCRRSTCGSATASAWGVAQQLLFFASPILYVAARYPESVQGVLDLSPLTAIFTQMRHALIDPSAPTAAEAAGGPLTLLVPLGLTVLTMAVGAVVLHARGAADRRAAVGLSARTPGSGRRPP